MEFSLLYFSGDGSTTQKFFTEEDRNSLLSFAFERYFQGRVMIGTIATCRETIE